MIEAAVFAALVGAMALVAFAPWPLLLEAAALATLLGMLVGLPSGLLYHLRLRAALLQAGALPPRWWLEPVRLHERLEPATLRRVLPSFYVGAAGFLLCALGCVLGALALPGALGLTFTLRPGG
jgi:hypothetical protein